MAQGDGSVVITVKVDTGNAEKEIAKLKREIDTLEKQLAKLGESKTPLEAQFTELGAQLDAAKAKLAALQEQAQRQFPPEGEGAGDPSQYVEGFTPKGELDAQIKEAQKEVDALQKKYDGVGDKIDAINTKMQQTQGEIDAAKTNAGELEAKLVEAGQATDASLNAALDRAKKKTNEVSKRVAGLIKRVLFYSVVTIVFRHLREWMGKVLEATDETSEAMKRLKAAALTAAQPIINVLTPAITALLNALTKLVSYIATVISLLFGSTFDESKKSAEALKDETDALNGVGGAAKKAGKSLANFDEINKLNGDTSGGGGGATTSNADFAGIVGVELGKISALVGASLLAIGAILTFNKHPIIGIALMAMGAAVLAATVRQNKDDIASYIEKHLNALLSIIGGFLAVIGVILLCTGHMSLGLLLLITGIAIFAAGQGEDDEGATLKEKLENRLNDIVHVISAAIAVIGVILLCTGHIPAGLALLILGITIFGATERDPDYDEMGNNVKSTLEKILDIAGKALFVIGLILMFVPGMHGLGFGLMGAGIGILAINEIVPNWDWILEKLKGVWESITGWWNSDVAKFLNAQWWKELGTGMMNGLLEAIETGVNWALKGIGSLVNGAIDLLNLIPGVDIDPVSWGNVKLPRLAEGAVIPPNREFLAVLGDQKRGTNIEAPLETIVQAFRQAMSEMGATGSRGKQTIVLEVDKREFGRITFDAYNAESQRVGVSLGGA